MEEQSCCHHIRRHKSHPQGQDPGSLLLLLVIFLFLLYFYFSFFNLAFSPESNRSESVFIRLRIDLCLTIASWLETFPHRVTGLKKEPDLTLHSHKRGGRQPLVLTWPFSQKCRPFRDQAAPFQRWTAKPDSLISHISSWLVPSPIPVKKLLSLLTNLYVHIWLPWTSYTVFSDIYHQHLLSEVRILSLLEKWKGCMRCL